MSELEPAGGDVSPVGRAHRPDLAERLFFGVLGGGLVAFGVALALAPTFVGDLTDPIGSPAEFRMVRLLAACIALTPIAGGLALAGALAGPARWLRQRGVDPATVLGALFPLQFALCVLVAFGSWYLSGGLPAGAAAAMFLFFVLGPVAMAVGAIHSTMDRGAVAPAVPAGASGDEAGPVERLEGP